MRIGFLAEVELSPGRQALFALLLKGSLCVAFIGTIFLGWGVLELQNVLPEHAAGPRAEVLTGAAILIVGICGAFAGGLGRRPKAWRQGHRDYQGLIVDTEKGTGCAGIARIIIDLRSATRSKSGGSRSYRVVDVAPVLDAGERPGARVPASVLECPNDQLALTLVRYGGGAYQLSEIGYGGVLISLGTALYLLTDEQMTVIKFDPFGDCRTLCRALRELGRKIEAIKLETQSVHLTVETRQPQTSLHRTPGLAGPVVGRAMEKAIDFVQSKEDKYRFNKEIPDIQAVADKFGWTVAWPEK